MAENGDRIEQQVKKKIKYFNEQRIYAAVYIGLLMVILCILPTLNNISIIVHIAIICSVSFIVLTVLFILSVKQSVAVFLAVLLIIGILFACNAIKPQVFLAFCAINAVTFLISLKIAGVFANFAAKEIKIMSDLKTEANTDSLTQLLNRNGLERSLKTAWAFCKREKRSICFIMADIDFFKSYNDELGHLEGDAILKRVADCIKACFKRESDIAGRIGGEEFLMILFDADDAHVLKMAKQFSSSVTDLKIKAMSKNSPASFLSVSIGITAGIPQPNQTITDYYNQADQALYQAKKGGRNCICFNEKIIKNIPVSAITSETADGEMTQNLFV